jgi:hypothetical protein
VQEVGVGAGPSAVLGEEPGYRDRRGRHGSSSGNERNIEERESTAGYLKSPRAAP